MLDAAVFPIMVADACRIPAATVFRMWDAGAFPTRVAGVWGIADAGVTGTRVVVVGVTGTRGEFSGEPGPGDRRRMLEFN